MGKQTQTSSRVACHSAREAIKGLGQGQCGGGQACAWESWKPESRERTCSNQCFVESKVSSLCSTPCTAVTLPGAAPLGAVSVGPANLSVHSEHLLQVCALCPHLGCTCSHGCHFLGRGELVSARRVWQQEGGRAPHVGKCHMCEHKVQAWHNPGSGVHSFMGTERGTGTQQQQGALLSMRLYLRWMDGVTVGR